MFYNNTTKISMNYGQHRCNSDGGDAEFYHFLSFSNSLHYTFFVKLCSQIFLVSLFIQEVCSITLTVQPVRRIVCSMSVGQFWGYDYTRPTVMAPFFDLEAVFL